MVISGFGVFTPVVMKSIIFLDIKSFAPLNFSRHTGRTYRRINRGRYQRESRLFEKFPPKRRINFKGLHGVICQITLLNGNLNPHTVATV
jgi:hypothetical protein